LFVFIFNRREKYMDVLNPAGTRDGEKPDKENAEKRRGYGRMIY
jgi:hypothetical protein